MVNELHGQLIISHIITCFSYPLYYDIITLTSLEITKAFHLLLGFAENQGVLWDFKIQNSIRITEGLDNGDLDNRGSTVFIMVHGSWVISNPVTKDKAIIGFCVERLHFYSIYGN